MLMRMRAPTPLPRSFYRRDAVTVARALLGQRLESGLGGAATAGLIVETEAYLGIEDRAAHTFGGRRTKRNASMWGEGGHAYVYFVYGMHHCFNVVTGGADEPHAVLVRALAPVAGIEAMLARRPAARRPGDLCSGPARLCAALGIDRAVDGADLVEGRLLRIVRARRAELPAGAIASGPRVGVDYAGDWASAPLRFWLDGDPHVSR